MKTKTKIVTMPDGHQVTFTASYRSGHDGVSPSVTGPIEDLILLASREADQFARVVTHLKNPQIEGLGFDGRLGRRRVASMWIPLLNEGKGGLAHLGELAT